MSDSPEQTTDAVPAQDANLETAETEVTQAAEEIVRNADAEVDKTEATPEKPEPVAETPAPKKAKAAPRARRSSDNTVEQLVNTVNTLADSVAVLAGSVESLSNKAVGHSANEVDPEPEKVEKPRRSRFAFFKRSKGAGVPASEAESIEGALVSVPPANTSIAVAINYFKVLATFAGVGLVGTGVMEHRIGFGAFAVVLIGVCLFVGVSILDELDKPEPSLVRSALTSLAIVLGLGLIVGGIQYFGDSAHRAAKLIPAGAVLLTAGIAGRSKVGLEHLVWIASTVVWVCLLLVIGLGQLASVVSPEPKPPVAGAPATGAADAHGTAAAAHGTAAGTAEHATTTAADGHATEAEHAGATATTAAGHSEAATSTEHATTADDAHAPTANEHSTTTAAPAAHAADEHAAAEDTHTTTAAAHH